MASCSRCGVTIRWAESPNGRVKLDNLPSMMGPNRFRETGYEPLTVEPVDQKAQVLAYKKHDCGGTG